jgi:hypothetical protein
MFGDSPADLFDPHTREGAALFEFERLYPVGLGDRPSAFQGEERRIPAADESFLSSPALIKANGRLHTDTRMQALTDVSFIF